MEDIKQEGLTLCEAMKYLYLGDRIWNTWTGESNAVICHYWACDMEDTRNVFDPDNDRIEIGFWSIIKQTDEHPEKVGWGEITRPIWCAETTPESV